MTAEDWKRRSVYPARYEQWWRQRIGSTHLEILSNLTNETLEGELPDEELSRLLITTDFTEGDGSGPETMGLLDTAGGVLDGMVVRCEV
jgi:hypothetical protein